jgi:hypothetical protein
VHASVSIAPRATGLKDTGVRPPKNWHELRVPRKRGSEVLSPSIEAIDRVPRLRNYAREGVERVWFVNPLTRTVVVLRLSNGGWVIVATHDGDATVNAEPFQAVPLDLFRLWGRSAPET